MPSLPDIKIHLYALCWNEEKMLPHFFRYYDGIVDRYFINDNHSTDGSVAILSAHPKVSLGHFEVTGDSFVQFARAHYNECWKNSRSQADWVIVCNIDEHIYHRNLKQYLQQCKQAGVTLLIPDGYEMISDTFPEANAPLYSTIPRGMRAHAFDKPEIFNPDAIEEINFTGGRHSANPTGNVVARKGTLKLLHFKHLGLDYLLPRQDQLATGLRAADLQKEWSSMYTGNIDARRAEFQRIKRHSIRVLSLSGQISVRVASRSKKLREHLKKFSLLYSTYQNIKTKRMKE